MANPSTTAMRMRGSTKAASIRLKTVVDRGIEQFLYVYDFGDNWRHNLVIEDVRDGERDVDYPVFVEGERRGPPEDVGGVTDFMELLEAGPEPRRDAYHPGQVPCHIQSKAPPPGPPHERPYSLAGVPGRPAGGLSIPSYFHKTANILL